MAKLINSLNITRSTCFTKNCGHWVAGLRNLYRGTGRRFCVETSPATASKKPDDSFWEKLNEATATELTGFQCLTQQKSLNIVKHRELFGSFHSTSDLLEVERVGRSTVLGMLSEFQKNENQIPSTTEDSVEINSSGNRKITTDCLNPTYSSDQIPDSVVSLSLQPSGISWARMDKDWHVTHWDFSEFEDFMRTKQNHITHFNKLLRTVYNIPAADLYIIEERVTRRQKNQTPNYTSEVNLARLEGMMAMFLSVRHYPHMYAHSSELNLSEPPSIVFKMKSQRFGRYYGLILNGERVTGFNVCRQILSSTWKDWQVNMDDKLRGYFSLGSPVAREQLALSLMQVTMFYQLLQEAHESEENVKKNTDK